MMESIQFLISGVIFGLVAGISPGPLLTLVISETLRNNIRAGIAIAVAPVLTDLPVVLASIFILTKVSDLHLVLGIISMAGAVFIGYLAYESIRTKGIEADVSGSAAKSLNRGVIANFLNPHPYLFWIAVGAPTVLKAYRTNMLSAVLFISSFYLFLVGSKMLVALLADKSKTFLKSSAYIYTVKSLGIILLLIAVLFIKDGLKYFGLRLIF
jgi:threonine/homoserine/homoserine lactone efflux protein